MDNNWRESSRLLDLGYSHLGVHRKSLHNNNVNKLSSNNTNICDLSTLLRVERVMLRASSLYKIIVIIHLYL